MYGQNGRVLAPHPAGDLLPVLKQRGFCSPGDHPQHADTGITGDLLH